MNQKSSKVAISRAKLGERIYMNSNDFILSDPGMNVISPSYNSLHDPHLRNYFMRRDMLAQLRKAGFITEENEVKCSFKEYRSHQRYLEHLKTVTERNIGEAQRARMKRFLQQQEKGLIFEELSLSDMREILLEEEVQCLRQQLKAESAREKSQRRRRMDSEEDFQREMDLLSWKVEERARLRRIEREVMHEWNRDKQLKDAQERRERKKQADMVRKYSCYQRRTMEKIRISEQSVMEERSKRARAQAPKPTTISVPASASDSPSKCKAVATGSAQSCSAVARLKKGPTKSQVQFCAA